MTRSSPFSVRGRRALLLVRDEREIAMLRRQLGRLGMTVLETDPGQVTAAEGPIDVIVLDADSIPIKSGPAAAPEDRCTDRRADRNRDAEPSEMAARPAARFISCQAVALVGNLHGAGRRFRCGAAAQRRSRPSRAAGGSHSFPARRLRRGSSCHAQPRALRRGRICADPADGDALSHDDRTVECGNRRARRHAEPHVADRLI